MSAIARSVIVHGHFYQPPREDPWLDEVEAEGLSRGAEAAVELRGGAVQ